jgi:tetratricopeptide (TPR) repeat protein
MASISETVERGLEHQKAGRLREAELSYRAALAQDPNNSDGLHLLGLVAHQNGQNDVAADLIAQAISHNARIAVYHSNLGLALFALGRHTDAIACQWRALELDPDLLQAHMLLNEALVPGDHYHQVLGRMHEFLTPRLYIEIGVETGASLAVARPPTIALGVDPRPRIEHRFAADTRIFEMTSDAFFASVDLAGATGLASFDLAFIDGMHTFDQALRDFINLEKLAHRRSVVLVHDCLPLSAPTATREQRTRFWSGDAWRLIPLLKRERPDLIIRTIACRPTGLAVIGGLDPRSSTLDAGFAGLVEDFLGLPFEYLAADRDAKLNVIANHWPTIAHHLAGTLGAPGVGAP